MILPRGKIHTLSKPTGAKNEANEKAYGAPVNILAKAIKKKYVNFSGHTDRAQITQVFYTNADVEIGDKLDGREVVEDFGEGKWGVK